MDTGVLNDLDDLIKNEQKEVGSSTVPQIKVNENMPETDRMGLLLSGRKGNYLK